MLAVLILLEQEDVLISRVFEVQNGEETISYIKKGSFNIALSDIEINSKQGLNEADISQIMKNSKPINIAKFITTVNNLATQLEEDYRLSNKIVIRNKKEIIFIPLNDILFIEKLEKNTIIHTKDKEYLSRHKLNELESKLPEEFLRVHKSYIVNIDKIIKIRNLGNRSFEIRFFDTDKVAFMSRYKFEELKGKIICGL